MWPWFHENASFFFRRKRGTFRGCVLTTFRRLGRSVQNNLLSWRWWFERRRTLWKHDNDSWRWRDVWCRAEASVWSGLGLIQELTPPDTIGLLAGPAQGHSSDSLRSFQRAISPLLLLSIFFSIWLFRNWIVLPLFGPGLSYERGVTVRYRNFWLGDRRPCMLLVCGDHRFL